VDYLTLGLLILVLIAIVVIVTPKSDDEKSNQTSERLVIKKKKCPPHVWRWQEIVDQDGNKQGERIICDNCGPIKL
jgi:hypothetical protein